MVKCKDILQNVDKCCKMYIKCSIELQNVFRCNTVLHNVYNPCVYLSESIMI